MVYDYQNDKVVSAKNENQAFFSASLAKLFLVAYSQSQFDIDDTITVTSTALSLPKANSSLAYLSLTSYSIHDIYAALLLPSGNDAAYALAIALGHKNHPDLSDTDALKACLKDLDGFLRGLGIEDTVIDDPSGFSSGCITTMGDVMTICRYLWQYSWFQDIVQLDSYTLSDGTVVKTTNAFLENESPFYNEDVKGIKTGSLDDAYHIVIALESKPYFILVVGSKSNEDRYLDTKYVLSHIH